MSLPYNIDLTYNVRTKINKIVVKLNTICIGCRIERLINTRIVNRIVNNEQSIVSQYTKVLNENLASVFPTYLEHWAIPIVTSYLDHNETHQIAINSLLSKHKTVESFCDEIVSVYTAIPKSITEKKHLNWIDFIGGVDCCFINDAMESYFGRKLLPLECKLDIPNLGLLY